LGSLWVVSAPDRGGHRKPKRLLWDKRRTKPVSGKRRKRPCAMPKLRARTGLKSSWPNAVSRTHCKWRLQPDSTEGTNMPTTQDIPAKSPIGRDTRRVDGPVKVTGRAQYASDFHF